MNCGKIKKPNISYFHIFGWECFVLNNKDQLGKFDSKYDKAIFLGYSTSSKAYKIFNLRTETFEESMLVVINKTNDLNGKRKITDLEDELEKLNLQQKSVESSEKMIRKVKLKLKMNLNHFLKTKILPEARNLFRTIQ